MTNDNNGLGKTEGTEERLGNERDVLPVNRRDLLRGTLPASFGAGGISSLNRGTSKTSDTDALQYTSRFDDIATKSVPWTVLLTNFETKWTSGWTSVEYYGTDNDTSKSGYFFMLKESAGQAKVFGVKNHNGFIGSKKEQYDWASGWTSVELFEVDDQRYLFLLKEGDGEVHIHEMKDDGTVGDLIFSDNWAKGWTTVEFFEVTGQQYLFLYKRGDGEVHIHEMEDNGKVGSLQHSHAPYFYDYRVSSVEFYEVDGQQYLFMYKDDPGEVKIYEMNDNGDIGIQNYFTGLSPSFSSAEFYEAAGQIYLFLLKERNGEVNIYEINDDGTLGSLKHSDSRQSGWTTATFYRPEVHQNYGCVTYETKSTPYLSLLNESNGEGHIYEIKTDGSIGARVNPPEPNPASYYEDLLTESGKGMGLVADYWNDVSFGQMDLKGSEVYGWITIPESWEEVKGQDDRADLVQTSKRAAENASAPPSTIPDGQVIAVQPEPPDSGATGNRNLLANPAGASSSLTFYTHEMGHVLPAPDFRHSDDNLDDNDTYDDPWDLMSAMSVCRTVFARDAAEGPKGPGLNAYYIDRKGWFLPPNPITINPDDQRSIKKTIKSLSKPWENMEEPLVLQVNTSKDSDADHRYLVELRTSHGWDFGFEEPLALIHRIVPDSNGDDMPPRVLRRTSNGNNPDNQGWSNNPPLSYVFDDEERIGITARSVQETIQPEGGEAEIYVGTKPGNVRLHKLDGARIGGEIERNNWAEGWTSAEFYEVDGQLHLFLLKEGDGEVHIHEMNDNGTVGEFKHKHNWASGWTSVEFFKAGGDTYLFLMHKGGSTGRIHIHKMKANGNVGSMTFNIPITPGLTEAESYEVGGQTYLFLLDGTAGDAYSFEVTDYGTMGTLSDTPQMNADNDTVEFYEAGGDTYLFTMREAGSTNIHEINNDGSIGALSNNTTLDPGLAQVEFYKTAGKTYFFRLNESSGALTVREVNANGTIGKERHSREWSSDWTTATVYEINGDSHLFILKESGI